MSRKVLTPDDPALPMNYPSFVFRTLRDEGHPAEALLANTGLEESRLTDLHFRSGFRPLRRLFLNAIARTGDPEIGVRLALKFRPSYIGLPSYAAMNAARFEDGLAVLTRFFDLTFPAFDFGVVRDGAGLQADEAAVRLRSRFAFEDIEHFGFSSALVAVDGLLKAMLQTETVAIRAETTLPRSATWSAIESEIGFPFRFGSRENRLVFPAVLLDRPLPGSDPINHARLLRFCEEAAAEMAFETTPVTQVLAVLERAVAPTAPLSDVAAELGYSERSLRRQLSRCGTSYRELMDRVRERRARSLLAGTAQPVKAIAGELGFESSSNFARSFRRWTGLTPKAFRERARAAEAAGRK